MNKPRLLLIAYRAFGDWIYSIPILPFLFKKYDVYLECNKKVSALVYDDPRFKEINIFDDTAFIEMVMKDNNFDKNKFLKEHLQTVYNKVQPDKVIDLSFSHENKTVASREQRQFFLSQKEREKIFGRWDYYSSVFDHIGMEKPDNLEFNSMYFSPQQIGFGERWRARHVSDFLVIIPPLGTTMQKFYPDMDHIILHIVNKYHNAYVYLMGDAGITEGSFGHNQIFDMTGKLSIKQSILMTKYADYVLGPETGLVAAAGMWGTPKTMLCNTCAIRQVAGMHENDYSLQSNWECSPCHRGIYTEADCEDVKYMEGKAYSSCVSGFKKEDIYKIIELVYEKKNIYNKSYFDRYVERGKTSIGKEIYDERWKLIKKYCCKEKTVLDYGCAAGSFLKGSSNGFIVSGYDINPYSPYHTQINGQYDILTMWDVIEHLKEPSNPILHYKPKYIFLTTPNLHKEVDFKTWKHNRPQEHLHYFNEATITKFLDELDYRVIDVNFEEGRIRDPQKPRDIITIAATRKIT